jgi:hypothetical protein
MAGAGGEKRCVGTSRRKEGSRAEHTKGRACSFACARARRLHTRVSNEDGEGDAADDLLYDFEELQDARVWVESLERLHFPQAVDVIDAADPCDEVVMPAVPVERVRVCENVCV